MMASDVFEFHSLQGGQVLKTDIGWLVYSWKSWLNNAKKRDQICLNMAMVFV